MTAFPATRASLLIRLRDRSDHAAWQAYVDLYAPLIFGYARKQGLQEADAADLCQEVLASVAASVSRFEYDPARGKYRNWLFKVMRSKLSNWRTAQTKNGRATGASGISALLEQIPALEKGEADWEDDCNRRLVEWACGKVRIEVTELTWEAFWRTAIGQQPIKEVASQLGISVGAVYHARSRIIARLSDLVRSEREL